MRDFFEVRIQYYDRRKAYLIEKLTEDWEKLENKVFLFFILFILLHFYFIFLKNIFKLIYIT
jgi:hypothetical protein